MAEMSSNLNLKLMKWRMAVDLDLDSISSKKCLLLGSGTLGCNVARCLLGWGVREMTFVDNGVVSPSNLTRQTLFEYDDLGNFKALAAAESMKKILPSVKSRGVNLTIPMPGHCHQAREDIKDAYDRLSREFENHDVIFLLTDSRECRWLPTALGAINKKLCINIALGFDSYLVMRHGAFLDGECLGCYFCSDVVSPKDSLTNRTLDQQCTITRPGISPIASAIGVELLVSLLQQKSKSAVETTFGAVPHQIRGFMNNYSNMMLEGAKFDKCTACSEIVISQLETDGFDFVYSVLQDPRLLERITGLDKLHETENLDNLVEWDESDSSFSSL